MSSLFSFTELSTQHWRVSLSKLPDWFLWKRYNWKTVRLQTMSLPHDITTEQVNMEVKDLWISFFVFYPDQLNLHVSIYSYFVNRIPKTL